MVERWSIPATGATETDVSVLLGALVRALRPDVVVETGTFHGDTAQAIGAVLQEIGGRLYSLEIDAARVVEAGSRLVAYPVTLVLGDSLEWTPPAPIDLLFADTEYVNGTRAREIRRFAAWASPRCVVITHDTVDPQARVHLEPLVQEGIVEPWVYLPTPYGLAVTRYKGGAP